jgi:hypothetical protein
MDFYELQACCPGNLAVPRALSSGVAPVFFSTRKLPNADSENTQIMRKKGKVQRWTVNPEQVR